MRTTKLQLHNKNMEEKQSHFKGSIAVLLSLVMVYGMIYTASAYSDICNHCCKVGSKVCSVKCSNIGSP